MEKEYKSSLLMITQRRLPYKNLMKTDQSVNYHKGDMIEINMTQKEYQMKNNFSLNIVQYKNYLQYKNKCLKEEFQSKQVLKKFN